MDSEQFYKKQTRRRILGFILFFVVVFVALFFLVMIPRVKDGIEY